MSGFHTTVETCGHAAWDDLALCFLPHTDLFLYDIKQLDPVRHEELTGLGSELIVENLEQPA